MSITEEMNYVRPLPQSCTFCGTITNPKIEIFENMGKKIHLCIWICPQCATKFKEGYIDTTNEES